MKQIIIISGKGGTGKTIISASLASLVKNKVMADCDVDASDLHLLLKPIKKEKHEFSGGQSARIDKNLCIECGECIEVCRFGAINKDLIVDPLSCEGCAVCSRVCPVEAITMYNNVSGEWFVSKTSYGPIVHARLGVAEENSGKLVTEVRKAAKKIAEKEGRDYIVIDGPPGIGCPVIASLAGTDFALIVTEPTLSGMHDLKRVLGVVKQNGVKTTVCINKFDLNLENTRRIKEFCKKSKIDIAGEIPFDKTVVESLVNATPLTEYNGNSVASQKIKGMWEKIKEAL